VRKKSNHSLRREGGALGISGGGKGGEKLVGRKKDAVYTHGGHCPAQKRGWTFVAKTGIRLEIRGAGNNVGEEKIGDGGGPGHS